MNEKDEIVDAVLDEIRRIDKEKIEAFAARVDEFQSLVKENLSRCRTMMGDITPPDLSKVFEGFV